METFNSVGLEVFDCSKLCNTFDIRLTDIWLWVKTQGTFSLCFALLKKANQGEPPRCQTCRGDPQPYVCNV